MKPLGMTADLQVTRPAPWEDAVWDAVGAAIDAGVNPDQFRTEAAAAWEHRLKKDAKDAVSMLTARHP